MTLWKYGEILTVSKTSTEKYNCYRINLAAFSLDPLLCSTVNDMLRVGSLDTIGYWILWRSKKTRFKPRFCDCHWETTVLRRKYSAMVLINGLAHGLSKSILKTPHRQINNIKKTWFSLQGDFNAEMIISTAFINCSSVVFWKFNIFSAYTCSLWAHTSGRILQCLSQQRGWQ